MMRALPGILIAAIALTIAAPALPALASGGHGLKKVYDPGGSGSSGGGSGSGAWCTATASVYYAADDENNVYVHSNQPYTDATDSADGYS
jgi:hypothetical protein